MILAEKFGRFIADGQPHQTDDRPCGLQKLRFGRHDSDGAESQRLGRQLQRFIPGTIFKISELLYALLIESNNDAAMALAGKMGLDDFVAAMNEEAQRLGIITTHTTTRSELTQLPKKKL